MPRAKSGYRTADGKRATGTTTITGRYGEKGALLQWAFKQGLETSERMAGRVATALVNIGKGNTAKAVTQLKGALEMPASTNLYKARDEAAAIGTAVHTMIEDWLLKKKVVVPATLAKKFHTKALTSFTAFQDEWNDKGYDLVWTEKSLVSEKYGYGGAPDALVKDRLDRYVLVDFKTGSGIYFEAVQQMAAYVQLIRECCDIEVDLVHVIRPHRDSGQIMTRKFTRDYLDDVLALFLLYNRAYAEDKRLSKLM